MTEAVATCEICPRHCVLKPGQTGACRARVNDGGKVVCANYGQLTAIALDPIEKKPLMRFHPGTYILSVGSYGCNLRCPFCQNDDISQAGTEIPTTTVTPDALVARAARLASEPAGNIGIAYTYNEPLVSYEFVRDCAVLAHKAGLKNVLVTNGMICPEPFAKLLPLIDALNIDLKGFSQEFYDWVGGDFETVRGTITAAVTRAHVEVTTLIIPGVNDSEESMDAEAAWLASLNRDLPLHISRFFPRYRVTDRAATPVETIARLCDVARRHLRYVYSGNC